jgi:hypothetical protein
MQMVHQALFYALSRGAQFVLLGEPVHENGISGHFGHLQHQLNDNPGCHLEISYGESRPSHRKVQRGAATHTTFFKALRQRLPGEEHIYPPNCTMRMWGDPTAGPTRIAPGKLRINRVTLCSVD